MSSVDDRRFWLSLWETASQPPGEEAHLHLNDLIIDTVAIAIHARAKGLGACRLDAAAIAPIRPGRAGIWGGHGDATHPLEAALLNGTASEVLDFQEVLIDGRNNGHAAVVIVPVLLALAEEFGISSQRLRCSMELALRANVALLRALGRGHRMGRVGFRTTSLGAPIAAAFAGAHLIDAGFEVALNAAAMAAAALPAGLLAAMDPEANSFSIDKDTAVGLSAQHAVHSLLLARNGAEGPAAALTGSRGWLASYGFETADPSYLTAPDSEDGVRRYQIKRFPVNFGAQAAVRAALMLSAKIDPAAISSVAIDVKESSAASLRTRDLSTHVAARFSLPYAVASALRRKRSVLADFEAGALIDGEVLGLMERCGIEANADMEARHQDLGVFPARVAVTLDDGAVVAQDFEGPWDGLEPRERTRALADKWNALIGEDRVRCLRDVFDAHETLPLRLTERLSAAQS